MTPERWQQIEKLYHAALELPAEEREQYLSAADESLRSEVESLLRNGDEPGLLDGRAIEVAAQQYVSVEVPDLTGRQLGRYEVLSRLGAGGMGIVYRARDTRLKRDVALKVLPAASIADPERKRRFVQEARAASALNHPNIVDVHDIDQIDGIDLIAMEYVPGKTLAQVIGRKALPVREALAYGIQIAGALAAAHAAGIVHRDLKPGNVMVQADGQVKVLDFGLAKLVQPLDGGDSTASVAIAGTPAYMSPEQAEGKKVDARSDIFSFGAVLYEMLSGRPAFGRDSTSATVAAVLRDDPKPVPGLVPGLQHLVGQCLRKEVDRRHQSIADVKIALEDLKEEPQAVAAIDSRRTGRWALTAAAIAIVAAAAGSAWLLLKPKGVRPPPTATQVTFDGRLAMNPSISVDGRFVAYASDRAGQRNLDIWVQPLPAGEPVQLTNDESNEDYPSFSPDGTKIAFWSGRDGGGVYVIPVLGGEPRLLAKNLTRPVYSPDGKNLLCSRFTFPNPEILLIPAEGGEPVKIQTGPAEFYYPVWSPDGRRIFAAGVRAGAVPNTWFVVFPAGGAPIVSYQRAEDPGVGTPLVWLTNNRILFSARSGDARNLWLAKVEPGTWKVAEPFERLTFGAGQITSASAANNGTVVFSSTTAPTRLWSLRLPKEGQENEGDLVAFPSKGSKDYFPSISLTGKMAYLSEKSGKWNVWIRDPPNGTERWLASFELTNPYAVAAVITPDGSRVAYSVCPMPVVAQDQKGRDPCAIFAVAASGGLPEKICDQCGVITAWSSDGTAMASSDLLMEGWRPVKARIAEIDPVSGKKTVLAEKPGMYLFAPDFSPDKRWVAFAACPEGTTAGTWINAEQLFVAPLYARLPVEPERWIAVTGLNHFDAQPRWSQDGKMLYFTSNRDGSTCLWAVRLDPATKKPAGDPFAVRHFHASPRRFSEAVYPMFSLGPDQIVISLEQAQSDLWMMQLP